MLPDHALFDYEVEKYAKMMKIAHFRGVFSLDKLPLAPHTNESAVINLALERNPGTHWTCYKKLGNSVQYFDSFGNLPPPIRLQKYFKGCRIEYNYDRRQAFGDTYNCGHLCLKFLAT